MCEQAWACTWRSPNGDDEITRRRKWCGGILLLESLRETEPKLKPEAEAWKEELNHWVGIGLNPGLGPGLDFANSLCARFVAFSHEALD